ncbi:MAG: EscU/YscU/HrcU family type III secretion system export apparatus switch protein [Myxococcales bacterium]|nr:EscU/YscU/HrcU family type III secretion system export apparatus switch protein [Myxococcales bacterium]
MQDRDQQTEKATTRQRERFRDDGKVAQSREILAVAVLAATVATAYAMATPAAEAIKGACRALLGRLDQVVAGNQPWLDPVLRAAAIAVIPIGLAGFAAALIAGFSQTKGLFTLKAMTPDLKKLNPLPRIKQIFFSKETLIGLLKSAGKVIVIVAFTYNTFSNELDKLSSLGQQRAGDVLVALGASILRMTVTIGVFLALFAAIDYLLNRRKLEQDMKMTKQQVKDEYKDTEGNPEIKGKQRARQREIGRNRMMAEVAKADVVLVNPTHYAVALRYDVESMGAPMMVGKGKDALAARIREVAREHRVPVMHNPPLTRALFASAEPGQEVPPNLYHAVAEVLALVYRLPGHAARAAKAKAEAARNSRSSR